MTVFRLMTEHKNRQPESHFFDRDALKFFGERISDMRVLEKTSIYDGHECYVLSSLQRNAPGGAKRQYFYFDINTFEYRGI